jgi:hypothetical protein
LDDILTFSLGLAGGVQAGGEFKITADGLLRGKLEADYMEDAKRKYVELPLEGVVDFQKKFLIFKE